MYRLLKTIAILCVGVVLGFHLNGTLMKAECAAADGTWSGTMCLNEE